MSIEEIDKKIRENAEKIRALMDEGDKLQSEKVKILYRNKMNSFELGKYVLSDRNGTIRIGKITKISEFVSVPHIEFQGLSDELNGPSNTFSYVLDDLTPINITDDEFEVFKTSVKNRKQNYNKATEHADNIKASFESFFRNTVDKFLSDARRAIK